MSLRNTEKSRIERQWRQGGRAPTLRTVFGIVNVVGLVIVLSLAAVLCVLLVLALYWLAR